MILSPLTLLGLAAATCTTSCLVPQVVKVVRTRHTKDLSLSMYVIFTAGVLLWLIYGFLLKDAPIILANSLTLILALTVLGFKLKYK